MNINDSKRTILHIADMTGWECSVDDTESKTIKTSVAEISYNVARNVMIL
jgi:hypothetical protein